MSTLIDSFWANSSVNRNRSFQMLAVTVTEWQIGKKERKVARCAENNLQALPKDFQNKFALTLPKSKMHRIT